MVKTGPRLSGFGAACTGAIGRPAVPAVPALDFVRGLLGAFVHGGAAAGAAAGASCCSDLCFFLTPSKNGFL